MAVAASARCARHPRFAPLARAELLRRLRGRSGLADVARGRRLAHLRDEPPARGNERRRRGHGAARARARRDCDARARRRRVCARARPLRRRRLPVGRARLRRRGGARRRDALLDPPALAAAANAPAAAVPSDRASASRGLPRAALVPRDAAAAALDVRADARRPGRARARDLVRREGGRRRPLAAAVLRHGTAALPSHARTVHRERSRGPRVVLRLLPRHARRLGRPRIRNRVSLLRRHHRPGASGSGNRGLGSLARRSARAGPPMNSSSVNDVSVVIVTHNGLPWIEQALGSVRGAETVLVDNASTDGTAAFVRERFPDVVVVEQENRGLAAGWNAGIAETSGRYVLLLNSDAWLDEGALDALVAFADAHPRAAVVGPRLRNPDGSLQRSVRGFPTLWRLATEYLFLRKLAPRSRALNAFYGAGLAHDEVRDAEFLMGAVWFVRRAAIDEVGPADESFFLFSEEVDWAYRLRRAGWMSLFFPGAGATHVYGASHQGRLFIENQRGHLRFLAKHRGTAYAERARVLLRVSLRLRGVVIRGERGRMYREAAAWLGSAPVEELTG